MGQRVRALSSEFDAAFNLLSPDFGDRVERAAPLSQFTTYRLGGPAEILVRVRDVRELGILAKALETNPSVPILVIGRGSNLVVADAGVRAAVVILEEDFESVEIVDQVVTAGAGVPLPVLARRCAVAGLSGLEFYVGIPGSIGGAVRMNAGGHGSSTAEVLLSAVVADISNNGVASERSVESLGFHYRGSALGGMDIVCSASFELVRDEPVACEERLSEIVRWRRENQPGGANAGSVFRNPDGDSAGRLIESCGLKGLRIGGVHVSEKHANFIQADSGAMASDLAALVLEIQRRVLDETGVRLETELHWVGFSKSDGQDEPSEGLQ